VEAVFSKSVGDILDNLLDEGFDDWLARVEVSDSLGEKSDAALGKAPPTPAFDEQAVREFIDIPTQARSVHIVLEDLKRGDVTEFGEKFAEPFQELLTKPFLLPRGGGSGGRGAVMKSRKAKKTLRDSGTTKLRTAVDLCAKTNNDSKQKAVGRIEWSRVDSEKLALIQELVASLTKELGACLKISIEVGLEAVGSGAEDSEAEKQRNGFEKEEHDMTTFLQEILHIAGMKCCSNSF
jgi:hypothetical protein